MTYLKRLFAMLLGITVLPARAIYYGLEFGVVALFTGFTILFAAPVVAAYLLHSIGISWSLNLFLSLFLAIPTAVVVVPVGLAVAAFYMIATTIVDVFKMAWLGLENGLVDGLDGFRRTWNNQNSPVQRVSSAISNAVRAYSHRMESVADQMNNEDDYNLMAFVDVPKQPHEVPDMQEEPISDSEANLLTAEEIKAAEELINEFSTLNIALAPRLKEQVNLLSVRTARYKDLSSLLDSVKKALIANDLSEVEDQLVYMDVTTPILLVKQYQTPDNNWHSVPANSYVGDHDNFYQAVRENARHPLNRDYVANPTAYEGLPTRYRWHYLTANACSAQELHEGSEEIRTLLETLPEQLTAAKQKASSPGSSPHALFSTVSLPQVPTVNEDLFLQPPREASLLG
ncbi:hypothetical protein [Legionella maioricensis]|uniref:Coiled coil protein n=1 Tax=Legionella maioricensis TaxID=2896528 RepID=A0A9X2D1V6_9GAMM|nr:hypothetical protein [Legionella maioricensis]MCL9684752.1 hypothetical protein [Legionella maioricensis]MCL9687846.1 hypothetical protein [Legionella maioricensis]